VGEPDPDGDLSPWLQDLEAYARDYTREELARLDADGLAYYDPAGRVWVVKGGPSGSFEISDAEVPETNAAGHLPDAYDTRFDGYTHETLDDLVALGQAVYDQDRGVWTIYGATGTYEVRDVDAPAQQVFMAGPDAGPPPLEALIDQATTRYDAGQPPTNNLDDIIFNALRAADTGDGTTSQWRADLLRQLGEAGARAWYEITYAGPLGNATRPIRVWDEESARQVAQRMSVAGEQADVALVATDGGRSVIASYVNQQSKYQVDQQFPAVDDENEEYGYQELREGPATGQLSEELRAVHDPWPEPPPWPTNPPPAAASVVGPALPVPAGDPRATELQFPQGIFPLDRVATSGGGLRPARLLHPGGTALDFRPMGYNESVPAVAAGVVPGTGDLAPGWLQVIQRGNGDLVAAHPALISPRGVNPLAWLPYAQVRRFEEFDGAEAAGRDSALLQAMFVEQGDSIRTAAGKIGEVTGKETVPHADGVTVTIATAGPGGRWRASREYKGEQTVEVLIPAHHPAEDSPQAGHMFGMFRPPPGPHAGDGQATSAGAELSDLDAALDWVRQNGTAHGPPPSFGRGGAPPSVQPGPAGQIGRADALQQGAGTAGLPPGGAIPEQAGWQVSLRWTATMQRVQSAAAAAIGGLAQDPAWLQLRALTNKARRLAADASAGRLRFGDPAWALRSWRAVWARVCEMTCDLAAGMMKDWLRGPAGRRKGSRPWQAARALHHAAAEGAAHAHSWLPREVRLPAGSYEIPGADGRTATARAKAMAAARQHAAGFPGPGSQLEFPAPADVSGRPAPGRPGRHRGAAANGRQARARPRPPRAG
jgi:hypothetical protein